MSDTLITIYRVEHRESREGPFWAGAISTRSSAFAMPNPFAKGEDVIGDFLCSNSGCAFFGFSSLQDVFRWFKRKLCIRLHSLGFQIVVLTIELNPENVAVSRSQVIFNRDTATLVQTLTFAQARVDMGSRLC